MILFHFKSSGEREFLSRDLSVIEESRHALLYDRLRGNGLVLDEAEAQVMVGILARGFSTGVTEIEVEGLVLTRLADRLRGSGFLFHDRAAADPRFDANRIARGDFARQLSLMVTLECNYACRDCFVFNEPVNILPRVKAFMSWATAEQALSTFFALRARVPSAEEPVVRLFGGEPLLHWPLIERIVGWVRERDQRCPIYLTTNGALLSPEQLDILTARGVTLFLSLNGIKEVNDRIRIDHAGRGTFDRTVKGLRILMAHAREIHIGVTLDGDDAVERLPELMDFLDRMRADGERPIVLYLSLMKGLVDETRFRSSDSELAGRIAHHWVDGLQRRIYLAGKLFLCMRNVFRSPAKFDRWCQRGAGVVVYPDGELRPCSGTGHVLGHVSELAAALMSSAFCSISRRLGGEIEGCQGCSVEGLCGGSCACSSRSAIHEYLPGINCDFERTLFRQLAKTYLAVYARDGASACSWRDMEASI